MLLHLERVLDDDQLAEVRRIVEAARFVDGTVSGTATLKRNLQVDRAAPEFDKALRIVVGALMRRGEFKSYALPKQITLEFNRYDPGMYYRTHMDAALMGGVRGQPMRTDLSFTVALSNPDDYTGGDFVLETPYGEQRIRVPAGNAIVYPSGMLHRVEAVESGSRWAAIGWIQSMLRDEAQRRILLELETLRNRTVAALPDPEIRERFDWVHTNLLRYWVEV